MAKTVFRPSEVNKSDNKVMLTLAHAFVREEEIQKPAEEIPEYAGTTVTDMQKEVEEFKVRWEEERARMLASAQEEADKIIKDAEQAAFEEVRRKTDQAQIVRQEAENDSSAIIKKAEEQAAAMTAEARQKKDQEFENACKEGFEKGREDGFQEGNKEALRLIDRLHVVLEKTMDKRQDILAETEQQVVDLVLLMARKVVKVISENQKNIVVSNIVQALRKVKGRGDVSIRVNLADIALTTEHIKDFTAAVESVKNITVLEDSSIEPGGCVVETDFGAIDARISSQLNELEQKILEISPIRVRAKENSAASEGQDV